MGRSGCACALSKDFSLSRSNRPESGKPPTARSVSLGVGTSKPRPSGGKRLEQFRIARCCGLLPAAWGTDGRDVRERSPGRTAHIVEGNDQAPDRRSYSAALVGGQRHVEYLVELGMPVEWIFT